jgi:hypothetical protein
MSEDRTLELKPQETMGKRQELAAGARSNA